ncbi:MAG: sulfite exporter TauE/SafE family protein [Chloroflexi bacterium]|nr:sulfite exporter TauE/SafE family protein [Chloroflexota bacterium]
MLALSLLSGFAIGLTLGLLGGGGSILTVPALVYLVGQPPQMAVTASLAIVGVNSIIGAAMQRARGTLNWRVALLFGGAGMIASYGAAGFSKSVAPALLMAAFALLMLLIGTLMLARPLETQKHEPAALWKIVTSGLLVGVVTGVLGVGGGFLIVPALVMLVGLPMTQAVGTSLLVIAMNSAAGFIGHLDGTPLDMGVIAAFIVAGLGGTLAGVPLAQRLRPQDLRRLFGLFVMALAVFLLVDNVPKVW